ncbi:hypothetical protein P7K49_014927, partial [Saguinus oedipus]
APGSLNPRKSCQMLTSSNSSSSGFIAPTHTRPATQPVPRKEPGAWKSERAAPQKLNAACRSGSQGSEGCDLNPPRSQGTQRGQHEAS